MKLISCDNCGVVIDFEQLSIKDVTDLTETERRRLTKFGTRFCDYADRKEWFICPGCRIWIPAPEEF